MNRNIYGPMYNPAAVSITGGTISGVTISDSTINQKFTTSTNPASSVATTTAIVDAYNGVVITTNVNNTQTIANPTTATNIKVFTVINNDTSSSNQTIKANSVDFVLTPGEAQSFVWDGSAWGPTDLGITSLPVPVTQGGTGLTTITDHGIMLGSGAGAVTPLGVATDGQIPIGSSGADPVLAAITPGDGIDVTNAAGSITVAVDLKANGGLVIDTTELTVDLSASAITGTLAVADGGTNISSYAVGDIIYASGATTLSKLADVAVGSVLASGGVTTAPAWSSTPTLSTLTLSTAITDNTATTQAASTAYAKSQDAVLARESDQGVAMTYAASGSTGIQVADNANLRFRTGDFTLVWKGSLPDWTPDTSKPFIVSGIGGPVYNCFLELRGTSDGYVLNSGIGNGSSVVIFYTSTAAPSLVDGTVAEIVASWDRDANVTYYVNGIQLGSPVSCATSTAYDMNSSLAYYIGGTSAGRAAGTTHHAATFNRALTAAEVLDLYRNGIAPKHRKASQTALTSGTLVTGQEYTIDTFAAGDDFANVGGTNETGNVFVATETTPTTWTNSSSLRATGGTLILEPEGIQPAPGQWLDSSSNKLHAMQPATGSSLTRYKKDFEYRWTNTWTASSAAQYVGGLNQAVLSADHFITDVITQATVTTDVENLTLGDGSAADKFVAAFAPSATRTKQTIAAQNDGTNLKLVYTPAAEATMTVETIIRGFIWEP